MKNKRFFCEWVDKNVKRILCFITILAVVLPIVVCVLTLTTQRNLFSKEATSYLEADYKSYFKEVINSIYDVDNASLNTSAIPSNVKISNLDIDDDNNIYFTCKVNTNYSYISDPQVKVAIFNNGDIIRLSNSTVKENFPSWKINATIIGREIGRSLCITLCIYLCLFCIYVFSNYRKRCYFK